MKENMNSEALFQVKNLTVEYHSGDAIIHAVTEQQDINAVLPPAAAVILIVLSIALTLIGGIIPSRKAAHSDPVSALRSE